jgi:hypothetical protein
VIDPENVMRLREAAVLPVGGEAYQLRWSQDSQVFGMHFPVRICWRCGQCGLETLTTVVLQSPSSFWITAQTRAGWRPAPTR